MITVFLRELDGIPDKLSVSSQSGDRQHTRYMFYTLYKGADSPISRIISLWAFFFFFFAFLFCWLICSACLFNSKCVSLNADFLQVCKSVNPCHAE